MPISCNREKNPAGAFYLVSWSGRRVIFKIGRILGHICGSTAVCHPVLIFMPLARGAACSQSRASACGDERPSPEVCGDITSAPDVIFTASASTIAAPSAAMSAPSAVAAMFSIPLISVQFLHTAGDLELTAFRGRVSCVWEKRGHRMEGVSLRRWPRADNVALLPPADFSLSSRSYWFITARSIHSRVG